MAFAICWALTSTSWGRASLGLVKIASSSHFNHLGQKQRMWEAWHPELIWFAFSFSPNYRTVECWSWKKLWKPFNPTQTFERGRDSSSEKRSDLQSPQLFLPGPRTDIPAFGVLFLPTPHICAIALRTRGLCLLSLYFGKITLDLLLQRTVSNSNPFLCSPPVLVPHPSLWLKGGQSLCRQSRSRDNSRCCQGPREGPSSHLL